MQNTVQNILVCYPLGLGGPSWGNALKVEGYEYLGSGPWTYARRLELLVTGRLSTCTDVKEMTGSHFEQEPAFARSSPL